MASKRERQQARKRYEKQQARAAKAARLRRERRIVAAVTVAVVAVVAVSAFLLTREPDPETGTEAGGTDTPIEVPTRADPDPLPTTDPQLYDTPPPATDALETAWDAVIRTNLGDIEVTLTGEDAPQAVANFLFLAQQGFYDGTACHRLLPDSLLQCGDPTASGGGGPGYTWGPIENAPQDDIYPAGTLAMARVGNDGESMGSQFFLVFADVPLPSDTAGGYTVFGQITAGVELLAQIGSTGTLDGGPDGRPATDVIITEIEIR